MSPLFDYNLTVARRVLLPNLTDVLFMAVFVGSIMLGSRILNTDGDLGRDITLGNLIIRTHSVPTVDVLSWSKAGQPRPPYEWLAEVLLASANQLFGLDGVALLTALVIGIAFAVVCSDAHQRSGLPLTSLLISGWAAIASSLHWLARPHVFSFLFLALWLRGLERLRTRRDAAWWELPAIMLLWANTHGGFVFGFAAWIAYAIGWLWDARSGRADRETGIRLLAVGGTSLVASILTPDLWLGWEAVLANRSYYILSQTAETMPPQLAMPAVWPFLILLVLGSVLAILNARRASACHVLLLAGLAVASLVMARNIPLFAIAAAPILALWIRELFEGYALFASSERALENVESSLQGVAWPVLCVAAVAGILVIHREATHADMFRFDPKVFPVQATDWIEANQPSGLMFNDFNWGGYLLYRLWPSQRVYIDSQSDFYGEQMMREYAGLLAGDAGWEELFNQYNVAWAVIPPATPLAMQLRMNPNWHTAYQDSTAVIFMRGMP